MTKMVFGIRVADYQRAKMETMVKVKERIIGHQWIITEVGCRKNLLQLQWVSFFLFETM